MYIAVGALGCLVNLFSSWNMCMGPVAIWVDRIPSLPRDCIGVTSKQLRHIPASFQILELLGHHIHYMLGRIDKRGGVGEK